MKKLFTPFAAAVALLAATLPAMAQDNLLAEKPIFTLGEAKTWSAGDQSYTFITDDLQKLVAVPTNTSNVFLYPENGTLNTEANQALGAQGFYIDMESVQSIGTVTTTWEGAAADSYDIYLTDAVPTPAILATTPAYSVTGLGQYTTHTAVMTGDVKGRYLVFQVTKATNWGWGVKIRSISASAPQDDVLTTFKVSPSIVAGSDQTPVTLTLLNQNGLAIAADDVEISVSDNAVYANGNLTILSGTSATFTATLGETLTATVYVATAPESPAATSIKTPIYTNTVTDYNDKAEFVTDWNGGATKLGELTFADGEVAQQFGSTRCVFFSNSETTGAWNANIDPSSNGYRNLCLDVFSGSNSECTIEFESVENLAGGHTYPFTLAAGQWNSIKVDVAGATKLGNLSIRFAEGKATDILLTNIFFTPTYVEGDETAPEIQTASAVPTMTSIELTLMATDDLSEDIYYSISDGTKSYGATAPSGETLNYTLSGLEPSTTYNLTITASDGKNISAAKNLEVKTLGMPDADKPSAPGSNVAVIYSNGYEMTELPAFDAWGSSASMSTIETESGNTVLQFNNYNGQWGGLVDLELNVEGAKYLVLDIFSESAGTLKVGPVWKEANGATTPSYPVEINANHINQWYNVSIPVEEIGYSATNHTVVQLALTESTLPSFALDNIYFAGDSPLSVEEINGTDNQTVNVFNLQGICVKSNVNATDAILNLPAGLYIVGSRKVLVK